MTDADKHGVDLEQRAQSAELQSQQNHEATCTKPMVGSGIRAQGEPLIRMDLGGPITGLCMKRKEHMVERLAGCHRRALRSGIPRDSLLCE